VTQKHGPDLPGVTNPAAVQIKSITSLFVPQHVDRDHDHSVQDGHSNAGRRHYPHDITPNNGKKVQQVYGEWRECHDGSKLSISFNQRRATLDKLTARAMIKTENKNEPAHMDASALNKLISYSLCVPGL
jgi:hypothetical protein